MHSFAVIGRWRRATFQFIIFLTNTTIVFYFTTIESEIMGRSLTDETPKISFIHSNKGKRLLVVNDHVFHQNKSTSKVTYCKCEQRMCSAGIHLDINDRFMKFNTSDHTHMPIPERVEIRKLMENVKVRVCDESTAIGQIYHEELVKAKLSRSALAIAATSREASRYAVQCLPVYYHLSFRVHSW